MHKAERMGTVAVLGGTGFVGRALFERWREESALSLRFLVHRSTPPWLEGRALATRPVSLEQPHSIRASLDGCAALINLLRPDGTEWALRAAKHVAAVLPHTAIEHVIHISSIDVYEGSKERLVTEETTAEPRTSYAAEHLNIEDTLARAPVLLSVVRPGAVFGIGGRNLLSIADEVRRAPVWRLLARRALYGTRRMHLVSAENVVDAIRHVAHMRREAAGTFIVTDDEAEENNFRYVQDRFLRTFDRPTLPTVPRLPSAALTLAMRLRGRRGFYPDRRFNSARLRNLGFRPEMPFTSRLDKYLEELARSDA
jgi:nucleoside-diphosphate-sugar epimerase